MFMNGVVLVFVALFSASIALASGGGGAAFEQRTDLQPATRFSGGTPIDLSHGLLFNNGTYGARNPDVDAWTTTPLIVPGVSERTYTFEQKAHFVSGLQESADFVATAIWNWQQTSSITKPEAAEFSKEAAAKMQPLLDKFKGVISSTRSAGKGDWEKAQIDARRALIDLRVTYAQLHNNVLHR